MSADFKIVWEFFERTGDEASGRGIIPNDWPDGPLVERFVSAELSEKEKGELFDFLKTHPHYIQYLVGRLRHAGLLAPAAKSGSLGDSRASSDSELAPPLF